MRPQAGAMREHCPAVQQIAQSFAGDGNTPTRWPTLVRCLARPERPNQPTTAAVRCNDADVDAGWFAVIGAAVGGAPQVITAVIQRGGARAQRKHDAAAALLSHRQQQVRQWREGLEAAHTEYQRFLHKIQNEPPRSQAFTNPEIPDAVGTAWFQSLRPHLSETGEAAQYRNTVELHCSTDAVVTLTFEIDRIERQWLDEAKG
jgi:hypothetical protein